MKKNFFTFLILLLIPVCGFCQTFNQFNFEYRFHKNIYVSKTKVFTKDMVADPSVTFKIKFTRKERKLVYNKLQEINFSKYPEVYTYQNADTTYQYEDHRQPCSGYSMIVSSKNYNKKVSWSDCITGNGSKDRMYEKLMELNKLIYKIISEKKAYKNSPPLRSGYL